MALIGRRHFCLALGAGIVGLAGALGGCSSLDDNTAAGTEAAAGGGVLAGLSFAVHRDPG